MRAFTRLLTAAVASFLVSACGGANDVTPTSVSAVQPTPTQVPAARGSLGETPIPDSVTRSALEEIRASGVVRVGILVNCPPFSYRADNGDLHGYEVDLIGKIADKWGVEVNFVPVTRQTRWPFLESGQVDMLAGAVPHRRELEQFAEFSETTFVSGYGLLVGNETGVDSPHALGSNIVGVVGVDAQDALSDYTTSAGIAPFITQYASLEDAEEAFRAGAIRLLVGRREDMMRAGSALPDATLTNDFIQVEPYAFALRRGDTPLRDLVNLTLYSLAKDGVLSQLHSANLYGYSDNFPSLPGDVTVDATAFPVSIASSESMVTRLQTGTSLRVGGLSLAPQVSPLDSQIIIDGFNRAVLNEMARRWNVPIVETQNSAGQSGIDMLRGGQVDIVAGVRRDASQFGAVGYSQPYYQRSVRLIHLSSVTINGIEDLNFKSVAVIDPLDTSQDLIQKNSEFSDIRTDVSPAAALQALGAGSIYAIVGDEFTLSLMLKVDSRMILDPRRYRATPYVFALPPTDADFISLVNFTLQDMKRDGTLDALQVRYFGPYVPADSPLEPIPMEIWPGDGNYLGVGR